jgi:hypothetical protein
VCNHSCTLVPFSPSLAYSLSSFALVSSLLICPQDVPSLSPFRCERWPPFAQYIYPASPIAFHNHAHMPFARQTDP